jgi:hypothetical protein
MERVKIKKLEVTVYEFSDIFKVVVESKSLMRMTDKETEEIVRQIKKINYIGQKEIEDFLSK